MHSHETLHSGAPLSGRSVSSGHSVITEHPVIEGIRGDTARRTTTTALQITLTIEPAAAAALHRLADKLGHSDAMQFLYPHLPRELRSNQAYEMVGACGVLQKALADAGVGSWPWIETGVAS